MLRDHLGMNIAASAPQAPPSPEADPEHLLREVMAVPPAPAGKASRTHGAPSGSLRLVKGSHIVVPKLFAHDHAYIFQGQDRRIIFAIPYERDFTLVGTTDVEFRGDPAHVAIDDDEVAYLCRELGRYLRRPIAPADVVWTYAGVRPLLDDAKGSASAVTRDYLLQAQSRPAPWLTVWGGKLTTFRLLSEQAANQVGEMLGETRQPWTDSAPLPGGDLSDVLDSLRDPASDIAAFQVQLRQRHPWMDLGLAKRWSRAYGSRALRLLDGIASRADLGAEVAPDLYEAELFYLKRQEWALTADDVLFSFNRQAKDDHPYHKVSGGSYDYFGDMDMPKLLKSVEKVDPYTVKVELNEAEAPFIANLAMDFASIHSAGCPCADNAAATMRLLASSPIATTASCSAGVTAFLAASPAASVPRSANCSRSAAMPLV